MRKRVTRTLLVLAVIAVALASAAWLLARDEVAALRAQLARAPEQVPPLVAAAIAAAEGPAPPSFQLVRSVTPRRSTLRWHLESAVTTWIVTRTFRPEQLRRVYANEVYLGQTADKRNVIGFEAASRAYFRKTAHQLTAAEAATLAGMIRSPNVYSPLRHPARARERRNKVLKQMFRLGAIDRAELDLALAEP